jgi:hypothetical protein
MPTKRHMRPLRRHSLPKVSDKAIELFKQMRGLPNCHCLWGPNYWERVECWTCTEWWALHRQLHDELRLHPGQYPAIDHPPDVPPYDEIEGGKTFRRSMRHAGGVEDWQGAAELFDALMQGVTARVFGDVLDEGTDNAG